MPARKNLRAPGINAAQSAYTKRKRPALSARRQRAGGRFAVMKQLELIGQIADLKETDCHQSLALETLIELLIEKGVFTRQEFARKAQALDLLAELACQQ